MKPKSIIISDAAIQAAIDARGGSFNGSANTILQNYFEILAAQRNVLRRQFSQAELSALLDANNGVWHQPITLAVSAIAAGVADAIDLDNLATKWKIDGPALVAKLNALSEFERLALIDWIARTWNNTPADWSNLRSTI